MTRRPTKPKRHRVALVHTLSTQQMSKQTTYALDESRRPKPYGQQLEDGFTAVNPDIW